MKINEMFIVSEQPHSCNYSRLSLFQTGCKYLKICNV